MIRGEGYYCIDCKNLTDCFHKPTYCSRYCKLRYNPHKRGVRSFWFKKEDNHDIYNINSLYDRYIYNLY